MRHTILCPRTRKDSSQNGRASRLTVHFLCGSDHPESLSLNNSRPGLVEQVKDGSTLRIRLLMPDGDHQFVNIALAGVRCPRVGSKPGETTEQWGEEVCRGRWFGRCLPKSADLSQAKFFTESRLLQRYVRVHLLSLPNASATPFQAGANATAPPPASIFIGTG